MPEMDGYQLLEQIRELANGENLPALDLTGYGRSTTSRGPKPKPSPII